MYIYKIFYKNDLLYIGSTVNIERRKINHKSNLKRGFNMPLYNYLRQNNINYEDLIFEIIKTGFDNIKDLRKKEGEIIKEFNPLCNKEIAGRTRKEYRKDNIEKYKKRIKEYYETNIEKERERFKKYRESNLEKERERHTKYHEKNKELINQKARERYNKNKQEKQI